MAMQHLQEVQPTLTRRALEASEQIVANGGAIAIASLVASPRIIGTDVSSCLQPGPSYLVLLLMEKLFLLRQDVIEFPCRNDDAEIMQLFQQQRLGHMA